LIRAGRVLHFTPNQNLVIRVEKDHPSVGQMLVDGDLEPVGKVTEVFGPVGKPYISAKPVVSDPERFVGKMLYAVSPIQKR